MASNRVDDLLRCALLILADSCPPDPAAYACRQCDADDVCGECWRRYLYQIANGERRIPRLPAA